MRPSGGNIQRWRFLVIKDAAVKQTVGATTNVRGTSRLRRGIGLVNLLLA
jgi:nitroreductase